MTGFLAEIAPVDNWFVGHVIIAVNMRDLFVPKALRCIEELATNFSSLL